MSKISIIIPILNEAKTIGILLQHLIENSSSKNIYEIIVVDGGSSDSSKKIVNEFVTSSDSIYGRKVPVANGGENKIESYRKADETKRSQYIFAKEKHATLHSVN